MTGLGPALAKPRARIAVITGDGEMLMGLGSLATIGVKQPQNLAILVLDNRHYGETGTGRATRIWHRHDRHRESVQICAVARAIAG